MKKIQKKMQTGEERKLRQKRLDNSQGDFEILNGNRPPKKRTVNVQRKKPKV